MSEFIFNAPPDVELLQWLARGSLKQNLLRAIRLWVWLHFLYGDRHIRITLPQPFTFIDCRDLLLSETHPKNDTIPTRHDPNCICAKITADWLFDSTSGCVENLWRRSLQQHDHIPKLDQLLQRRLFAVTRRSLQGDLHILSELGWLKRQGQQYWQVQQLPAFPRAEFSSISTSRMSDELGFLHPDLDAIAQTFSQPINGFQRFFLEVDYIVDSQSQDQVDEWFHYLKQLWEKIPIPPIQITYNSARAAKVVTCIVYPVCIYYVRRALYLCAFGNTPTPEEQWYNYRLDRIQNIVELNWENSQIPQSLYSHYPDRLPNPDDVLKEMSAAWGFDFYKKSTLLLLRFERNFHDRYIKNTFRHDTFQKVTYSEAQRMIIQSIEEGSQKTLLNLLQSRSSQDAYYCANYREGDINVLHRLRSWRPNVEVISPWKLRQKIAEEVTQEAQFYQD